jgi:hypothetical protein
MVKETKYMLSKHFDNYEKSILLLTILVIPNHTDDQFNVKRIIQQSKSLKVSSPFSKINKINSISFDCNMKNKLKYFTPPRFLIVEDNAFGRINLIDILKKQKFNHVIDIAAFGMESIQKFKFFLNKG